MSEKLPAGVYVGTVRSGVLVEDDNQKPFVAFVCDVLARVAGTREAPLEVPLTRTIRRYLTDAAAEYTMQDLRNLGWRGRDFGELTAGHPARHDFAGTACRLKLDYRPYKGQDAAKAGTDVENWEFRMGGPAIQAAPAAGATVARLNALFAVKLAVMPAASVQRAPQPQRPTAGHDLPDDGDKIPF